MKTRILEYSNTLSCYIFSRQHSPQPWVPAALRLSFNVRLQLLPHPLAHVKTGACLGRKLIMTVYGIGGEAIPQQLGGDQHQHHPLLRLRARVVPLPAAILRDVAPADVADAQGHLIVRRPVGLPPVEGCGSVRSLVAGSRPNCSSP